MSIQRSTSFSTEINSSEGINSDTWLHNYQAMGTATLKLPDQYCKQKEFFLENEINSNESLHFHSHKNKTPGVLY